MCPNMEGLRASTVIFARIRVGIKLDAYYNKKVDQTVMFELA